MQWLRMKASVSTFPTDVFSRTVRACDLVLLLNTDIAGRIAVRKFEHDRMSPRSILAILHLTYTFTGTLNNQTQVACSQRGGHFRANRWETDTRTFIDV